MSRELHKTEIISESMFQAKIIKYVQDWGGYVVKYNASGLSKSGVPDLLCCYAGRFIGIEVKKEDGVASALQLHNQALIRECGGECLILRPSTFHDLEIVLQEINREEWEKTYGEYYK